VIGPIVDDQSQSAHPGQPPIKELALSQGNKLVPLGSLTQKFVASKCPSLGGKAKVFLFLNTNRVTDHAELTEVMLKKSFFQGLICLNFAGEQNAGFSMQQQFGFPRWNFPQCR
jgi:hypothetical protein